MSASDSSSDKRPLRWPFWVLAAALIYGGVHLLWYWQTPFGQVPVLDERESLDLARLIATGDLPAEPFYRAPGYPLFLSLGYLLGLPSVLMPFAATAAGLLIHGFSAYVVALCSRRLFQDDRSALFAGLLYGLNPVLIHQATQILDGTLANLCLLIGALGLIQALSNEKAALRPALVSAFAWSLTALIRPQLLVVWLGFPLLWWLTVRRTPEAGRRLRHGAAALLISLLPLLVFGLVQKTLSGRFRLMPTQGAYNLWAANRPGAQGRFFAQTVHLSATDAHYNPTLVESRVLYTRETGLPAADLDTVNAYWSRRLRESALADPADFIGRFARRLYYLFNDAEQYNNKTYSFHKARSPVLRLNPVGWGVVFVAGLSGLVVLAARDRRAAFAALALGAAATASIAVAFVSDRFRLPLVAGASVCAGGVVFLSDAWKTWTRNQRLSFAALLAGAAMLTYSRAFDARSEDTIIQDHLLLASAAVQTGDDALAWSEAGAALALSPNHPDALAWRVTSYFNQLVTGSALSGPQSDWADAARHWLKQNPEDSGSRLTIISALALWRSGDQTSAQTIWRTCLANPQTKSDALGILVLAGLATPAEQAELLGLAKPSLFAQTALAIAAPDSHPNHETLAAIAHRLFPTALHER